MPSKQLGQNFLTDPDIAKWIVAQLKIRPDDAVVEVGPGTGALSEHLVGNVRRLILIEFDARLAAALAERFRDDPTVEVHHEDGAKFDRRILFKQRPLKFLGNLPYSSGGAILKNLLARSHPFERAVVMLQKEVIDRLAAVPGTKDYGLLSLRTQIDWHVEPLRTVPPEAFHPRPAIDSTVAVLTPRTDLPVFDRRLFDELTRRGFSQRRKQLKNQLPAGCDWSAAANVLGVSTMARAEELSLEKWIELTRECDTHPLKDLPQKAGEIFDVVDENDEVTGQAARGEVHADGWKHRAVHVFAFNKRGQILLQQRSHLKDMHPDVWDSSVAGHLDAGEDYEAAAIRELDEEMGIIASESPRVIGKIGASEETGWEFVTLFETEWSGAVRYPAAEVAAAMWFPTREVESWIENRPADFAPGFLACWKLWKTTDR
ncbi:MAG: 16S rRNA (adenine(1518)-N(6)/adenine(1519)-N(6))-dimethyltransferase RsmA [Verrucomicrobiota bacterium]